MYKSSSKLTSLQQSLSCRILHISVQQLFVSFAQGARKQMINHILNWKCDTNVRRKLEKVLRINECSLNCVQLVSKSTKEIFSGRSDINLWYASFDLHLVKQWPNNIHQTDKTNFIMQQRNFVIAANQTQLPVRLDSNSYSGCLCWRNKSNLEYKIRFDSS